MCEIFGISSCKSVEISNWLIEFYRHSEKIPNGWGLAIFDEFEVNIEKEPVKANSSQYLKERLSQPVITKCAMAHIRHALPETMKYSNCHPFTIKSRSGRRWTLAHNGAIFDFKPLEKYKDIQQGTTDTERILLYIVDQMNNAEKAGISLSPKERFIILDAILCSISDGNRMNIIIYDSEYMYVHTNKKNDLFYLQTKDYVLISTKPLDDNKWEPVPFTTLMAFKDGEIVFSGTDHGKEFIETEEHLRILGFVD